MTIRVAAIGTGNVGRHALAQLITDSRYELTGVWVSSEAKAGRDAAELAGLDGSTGVIATTDLDEILAWSPDLVILDEAQRIKNWKTRAARTVKKVASPYAIVLTGTPLENRLEELISIVQFVDRFRLGPTYKMLHEHQQREHRADGTLGGWVEAKSEDDDAAQRWTI